MVVNRCDLEVSEQLAAWVRSRDDCYALRSTHTEIMPEER